MGDEWAKEVCSDKTCSVHCNGMKLLRPAVGILIEFVVTQTHYLILSWMLLV